MKKTYKLPAFAGAAALAAVMLSGCGSPAATFEGKDVEDLDKTIESLDTMWAQERAEGTKSNVDEESRCYAQVTDLVMSDEAICGPIHYLGSDDQVWETIPLSFSSLSEKKTSASADGSFVTNRRADNTTLLRPDGKEFPEGLVVPEPDTETAAPEQAIWDSSMPVGADKIEVGLPDSVLHLSGWGIAERIGDKTNRLKAGDGHMFASIRLADVTDLSVPTELAFVTNGKSYPVGAPQDGGISMSLPGDAKDASLAVTTEGNTQTVSLATGEITSTASAYYDGLQLISEEPAPIDQDADNGSGQTASFQMDNHVTWRDSYDEELGWAPEGKAWLSVDTNWETTLEYSTGGLSSGGNYEHDTTVTSATVEGLSGERYTSEAARIDNGKVPNDYRDIDTTRIVFEVPAGVGDFQVTLAVNASGARGTSLLHEDAPESASVDDQIVYDAIFPRKVG